MSGISVTNLQRAAQKYDPILKKLPFLVIGDELARIGMNLLEVVNKDTIIAFERKQGIARPYSSGINTNSLHVTEVGKAHERHLTVEPGYIALKEHSQNYKNKIINAVNAEAEKVDNKTQKHPKSIELLIIESIIRTVGEDILDAVMFSKRDTSDLSPMGLMDGFHELIDTDITAGEISVAKGNLINTGALSAPTSTSDTAAWDRLVAFLRSAHPMLRKRGILYMTSATRFACQDALGNKLGAKGVLEDQVFMSHLKGVADLPETFQIITSPIFGAGSRLIFTEPRNFDVGMNTISDKDFVGIRQPWEDPNLLQYWMQFEIGARVRLIHPKSFCVNNQTNTAIEMSGDYS